MNADTVDLANERKKLKLVLMVIHPNDDSRLEIHHGIDQFIRIEEGKRICRMGSTEDNLNFEQDVKDDDARNDPNEQD